MRRFPKKLSTGDRVAIICPSSAAPDEEFSRGVERVKRLGFEPIIGKSCSGRRAYLAADSDEVKAEDVRWAFADDSIAGIMCARGGSGAGRILPMLDADEIASHPKVFAGYSDITALHTFLAMKCNMLTFLAPMATSSNLDDESNPTRGALIRALTDDAPLGIVCDSLTSISYGTACGELVGGNLSVLVTTLGTPWEIETAGKILFIEDVDEAPYSIDRMLAHLRNAGKLAAVAGVVLGDFTHCEAGDTANYRDPNEIFGEYFGGSGVPVAYGLHCGHGDVNVTLPLGAIARLDADNGTLLLEDCHFA